MRKRTAYTTTWIVEQDEFIGAGQALLAEVGMPDAEIQVWMQDFDNGPYPVVRADLHGAVQTPELRALLETLFGTQCIEGRPVFLVDSSRNETVGGILKRALAGVFDMEDLTDWEFVRTGPGQLQFHVVVEEQVEDLVVGLLASVGSH